MKFVSFALASALSLANSQSSWTFEDKGRSAFLTESEMADPPLRLACGERGFLEINIRATSNNDVTLVGPTKIALTIRGAANAEGRVISQVYFRSMTVEFLREEGDVEAIGAKPYRLHLWCASGAAKAGKLCLAVS